MCTEVETRVFECVAEHNTEMLKELFFKHKLSANIFDKDGMTPLQHASYKGFIDIAQFLLDSKADVNSTKHEHSYSALHFAALSGNSELCLLLMKFGAKCGALNSVNRTPSQLAAFVGNHDCAAVINNFIAKSDIDYHTVVRGTETEPKLQSFLSDQLHGYLMMINIHPIRIALSTPKVFLDYSENINKVLEMMCAKEIKRGTHRNEVIAFKIHYLRYVFCEFKKCSADQQDPVEIFAKRILRGSRGEEYLEQFIRECIREFPFREGLLFQQIVMNLTKKDITLSAFALVISAINGQRNFLNEDNSSCFTCAEPKAIKKCSKCRVVQYCDRQCQRLHWFMHKKTCTRPSTISNITQDVASNQQATGRKSNTVNENTLNESDATTNNALTNLKIN